MPAELTVGVIGAGWASREHCTSLRRLGGTRIAAVFDVSTEAAQGLAHDVDAPAVKSVEDVLAVPGLDAVIIGTPSGVHREAVVTALDQGTAVFVEKPLARTVADAQAIAQAAQRSGVVCAVGYQWRAVDGLAQLRTELAAAEVALLISQGIGITQARSWFGDSRLSGGLVYERVSHHIDLQRMLGGEVSSVSAVAGAIATSGVTGFTDHCEDVLSLSLSFASGAVGAIHVVWAPETYPPTQSLRVLSTAAAYDLDLDPDFVIRRQGGASAFDSSGEHPFLRQMRLFLDAVRAGDPTAVCCTPEEAAGTVTVAAAAERALATSVPQFCAAVRTADPSSGAEGET